MTADVGAQLRKGVVESCVLGLLAREPMYGWQLSEHLTRAGLIASIGTLYPVLGRLRDRGLVAAFERATGTGPVRKYYRLTPTGTAELARFQDAWGPFTAAVGAMLADASDASPHGGDA
ncbi:PadR family transcriptional regulator [Agrococcus jejuensis]|uniref:Transcriptional regulator, PadR family n=1 Tax=Agrococcus jejuensis TaxID=399736 RepID=A0A1G8CZ99_9MICO|nr:PadR family transcriptional regulator [Agrococcus jejuensis]SDH50664.1 transcriptional regulator, PadR family [Agrococcus jejuensis]